jgi:hypothetical protein
VRYEIKEAAEEFSQSAHALDCHGRARRKNKRRGFTRPGDAATARPQAGLRPLRAQLAKSTGGDQDGPDAQALIATAHRLDNLVHHRRMMLAARASAGGNAG